MCQFVEILTAFEHHHSEKQVSTHAILLILSQVTQEMIPSQTQANKPKKCAFSSQVTRTEQHSQKYTKQLRMKGTFFPLSHSKPLAVPFYSSLPGLCPSVTLESNQTAKNSFSTTRHVHYQQKTFLQT